MMTCGGGACGFTVATRTPRQHFLNFFPLPHGHCSFLLVFGLRLIANLARQIKSETELYADGRRKKTSAAYRFIDIYPDADNKIDPADKKRIANVRKILQIQ